MRARSRMAMIAVGAGAVLVYGASVGYLALSETSIVYYSAGEGKRGRLVPGEDATFPWDTLRVRASDGVPVLLLRSTLDSAAMHPWAIYFHGNAGFIGSRGNVARYRLLREAGFNVLAVEYRGYGASANVAPVSEEGINRDARAALTFLTDSLGVPSARVLAYGWSLGSGPATRLAADARLGALVTEGAFTSLPDMGAAEYPWMPVRLVMRNRFDNMQAGARLEVPWVVFHGTRDDVVPYAHGERLAMSASMGRLVSLASDHEEGAVGDTVASLPVLRELARRMAGKGGGRT